MTAGKRVISILSWIVANGVMWTLVVLGTIGHSHPTFLVFKFLTWLFTIVYALLLLAQSQAESKGEKLVIPERGINKYVAFLSDLGAACLCAAFGHWFYGALVMVQQFMEQSVFDHKVPTVPAQPNVQTNVAP